MALDLHTDDELMADLTDVLNVLAQQVEIAVYPNGTMNPSVAGVNVTTAAGWPVRNKLDDALLSGGAIISVYPDEKEKAGPVFERGNDFLQTHAMATITAVVSGNSVTIGGTVTFPQAVVTIVDGVGYGYALQMGDTLDTIAANIAALLPSASVVGNVITVMGSFYNLETRISTAYPSSIDLGRQYRWIMISCWCPTPTIRAALGAAVTVYFKTNYRILLPDNFYANLFYVHTREVDMLEKQAIFRRDIIIKVLYATTSTTDWMTLVWPVANTTL